VHSVIEAPARDKELGPAKKRELASDHERIEDSNLDVRMSRERPDRRTHVEGFRVVDEQAHAHTHTAIGGFEQRYEQQLSGIILRRSTNAWLGGNMPSVALRLIERPRKWTTWPASTSCVPWPLPISFPVG
jgi:hypothetical protein